nr:hypothetical protein [Tanacetum cinerariifolium]
VENYSRIANDLILKIYKIASSKIASMQLKLDELTGLCTSLQRQHSEMVAKFKAQELEINRNLDEGEAAFERVSDDTEEMATVLTSMDATTVLASGVAEVPTSSGSIHTAGPPAAEVPTGSDVVPTAGLIFTTATVLKEEMERDAQRMNEHIARDAKIASIHAEEELQILIDGLDRSNETVAKYLQEYHQFATELPLKRRIELISDLIKYQDNYAKVQKFQTQQRKPWSKKQKMDYYMDVIRSNLGWKVKDFRGMTFKEIEAKFTTVWKQLEDFIPIGLKEEEERFKRKGIRQPTSDKEMELWVELKRLYEPDDEDQLWTHTQNLMHAPVEWKLYDMCGVHQVTLKDKEIFMLVEKDYPLRKGLAILEHQVYGRIVGNKMHKAFLLPVIEFPLLKEVPTARKKVPTARRKEKPLL